MKNDNAKRSVSPAKLAILALLVLAAIGAAALAFSPELRIAAGLEKPPKSAAQLNRANVHPTY